MTRQPLGLHGSTHLPPPHGQDPIPGVNTWRNVFGQIDGSSTTPLDPGSGDWTVTEDFAGTWTITVDPPFGGIPTVVASENGSTTNPPSWIQVWSATVDTIVVKTYDHAAALSDDIGFNFIAVGSAS